MAVDAALQQEIEQFLYTEAALLDERQFHAWLDLLTDDVRYWMPIRTTRARQDLANEFTQDWENSYFDDDKTTLARRVAKLDTGYSWAEEPPSRTRHMVTNVRIFVDDTPGELRVFCNFVVYRTQLATDEDLWIGRREDRLRQIGGQWRIAERKIFLDQTVLKSKNLSCFF